MANTATIMDPNTGLPTSSTQTVSPGNNPVTPSFTVPSTSPVSPSNVQTSLPFDKLATTPSVQGTMVTPTPTVVPSSAPTQALSYSDQVQAQLEKDNAAKSSAQTNNDAAMQAYLRGLGLTGTPGVAEQKAADTAALDASSGIVGKRGTVTSIRNQILSLDAQTQANKLQVGQNVGGITTGDQAGFQNEIDRNSAIKKLGLSAMLYAAEGDLTTATEVNKQAIDAKYGPEEAKLASIKEFLNVNKDVLERSDAKAAKDQNLKIAAAEKDLAERKQADTDSSKLLTDAAQVAPQNVLAKAQAVKDSGGTPTQVAVALGQYGGDYLAREKMKAEIKKMNAEDAKANRESPLSSPGVTGATSSSAKDWLSQFNSGLLSAEDIYTKIGTSKESIPLKNEVAKLIAAQGGKRVYGQDDASVQAINAQIKNVNDLLYGQGKTESDKTTGDYGTISGFVQGGLGIIPDSANVYKQDALAIAKNLISNQTLQSLAEAKAKGITFGALSEAELNAVSNASGRIASKIKKDKDGNITGFSGSESQFKDDLKTVKEGLQKSIATKTQVSQNPAESAANDIMTAHKNVQSQIKGTYNIFDK